MPYSKQSRFADVRITQFSNKGNGTGQFERGDGKPAETEISFAVPGDLIHSIMLGKKQGKWKGRIEKIIEESRLRITPLCKHFGTCGGCRWQQISYEEQLKNKESIVKEFFDPILPPDVQVRPIVSSNDEWQYRNKMEFTFSSDINRNKYLGLIMDSSKGKVINLTECHLVNNWFIQILKVVRFWWEGSNLEAYHPARNMGSLRTLILREGINTGDRMVILTVSGNPDYALNKTHLDSFVDAVKNALEPSCPGKLSIFLRIQQIAKGMATNFFEMLLYGADHIEEKIHIQRDLDQEPSIFRFKISPSVFFQPNTRQAERFYSLALKLAKVKNDSVVYDLFCGTGTLGICTSRIAKRVVGIEISPEAASDARQNAALNKCQNVTILTGAVRHVLSDDINCTEKLPLPDVVFVDPPRPGLDSQALQNLARLNSPTILFISCNPKTQAANVKELMDYGYKVKAVQPFDQFPQTIHIENIVLLEKN